MGGLSWPGVFRSAATSRRTLHALPEWPGYLVLLRARRLLRIRRLNRSSPMLGALCEWSCEVVPAWLAR